MFKTARRIVVEVDGVRYCSTVSPRHVDFFDGTCEACGSPLYSEILTIIQHGMFTDQCVTFITCARCFETFHYPYEVEAASLYAVARS